jgi:oligosaccharide repeat unit polymerase
VRFSSSWQAAPSPRSFSRQCPCGRPSAPATTAPRRQQAHVVAGLGLVGAAWNISNIFEAGGLAVYTELGLREAELIFGASTLVNYVYFLCILGLVMLVCLRAHGVERRVDVLLIVVLVLALAAHGLKSTVIWPLAISAIVALGASANVRLGRLALIGVAGVLMFIIVSIGRELPLILLGQTEVEAMVSKSLLNVPLYFSSGMTNLQLELQNAREWEWGVEQLIPLYELGRFLLGLRGDSGVVLAELHLYHPAYNTGTYLREPFRDFGWAGMAIAAFVAGVVSTTIYRNYMATRSPYAGMVYGFIGAMLFAAFFSNHFLRIQYLYLMVVIGLLSVLNPWRRVRHAASQVHPA